MKALLMTMGMTAIALTGCTPVTTPETVAAVPETVASAGKCDASKVQDVIGRPLAEVQADAQARSGAAIVRAYGPNAMLTKDFREDRLNIETDAAGVVVRVSCG